MTVLKYYDEQYQKYINTIDGMIDSLSIPLAEEVRLNAERYLSTFKMKIEDFYREGRKLNIGVIGQVKAGKSSFLNAMLFDGETILPKASTPKTATLTKMEYGETNSISIEFYTKEEWEIIEENAAIEIDDEIYNSARELIQMAQKKGLDVDRYLEKKEFKKQFDTYDNLVNELDEYVGENGYFTPIVKSVVLQMNKEELKTLSIVDTPGLNDPIVSRTIQTKEFMNVCDVVFFLSQTSSFLDMSDWVLLTSQLPQKGVKRLILVGSKYDSGVRDLLRKQRGTGRFGRARNIVQDVPTACSELKRKLTQRACEQIENYSTNLLERGVSKELIEVIKQCEQPIMFSYIAFNILKKSFVNLDGEESNCFEAIKQYSDNLERDFHLLCNIDQIRDAFDEVVKEKERIFEQKAKTFIPTAHQELKEILNIYHKKAIAHYQILVNNDKDSLLKQKQLIENQIGSIKADIAVLFGELNAKIETEKGKGMWELRQASSDCLDLKERTGTRTKEHSYTTGWWIFKKTHYYTSEEHYSYCIASDAVDNLRRFSNESVNQIEKVFYDSLQLKDIKRRLLNVIVKNFDTGSEKYDAALFKVIVENAVNQIEFPVLSIDISGALDEIAVRFTGEIVSAKEKNDLSTALSKSTSRIFDELCNKFSSSISAFKHNLSKISEELEINLLTDINAEFDVLLKQYENKEKEIEDCKCYIKVLEQSLNKL